MFGKEYFKNLAIAIARMNLYECKDNDAKLCCEIAMREAKRDQAQNAFDLMGLAERIETDNDR